MTTLRRTDHFATPESFGFIDAALEFIERRAQLSPAVDPVAAALAALRAGGLVAIPTETVYGLGADASNPAAVRPGLRREGSAGRPSA